MPFPPFPLVTISILVFSLHVHRFLLALTDRRCPCSMTEQAVCLQYLPPTFTICSRHKNIQSLTYLRTWGKCKAFSLHFLIYYWYWHGGVPYWQHDRAGSLFKIFYLTFIICNLHKENTQLPAHLHNWLKLWDVWTLVNPHTAIIRGTHV